MKPDLAPLDRLAITIAAATHCEKLLPAIEPSTEVIESPWVQIIYVCRNPCQGRRMYQGLPLLVVELGT